MSLKATCKTSIDNEVELVEALEDIYGKGNGINKVQHIPAGVDVRGYNGNGVRPTVLVQIPGLIGTAGFHKGESGTYSLIYDSMDRGRLKEIIPSHDKNGNKVDRLSQTYAKLKVQKSIKANLRNARITSEDVQEDGSIRIRLKVKS